MKRPRGTSMMRMTSGSTSTSRRLRCHLGLHSVCQFTCEIHVHMVSSPVQRSSSEDLQA